MVPYRRLVRRCDSSTCATSLVLVVAVGVYVGLYYFFFFSSRRRHTRLQGDWSSDVCSSDLYQAQRKFRTRIRRHQNLRLETSSRAYRRLRIRCCQDAVELLSSAPTPKAPWQIGRASCRERV